MYAQNKENENIYKKRVIYDSLPPHGQLLARRTPTFLRTKN